MLYFPNENLNYLALRLSGSAPEMYVFFTFEPHYNLQPAISKMPRGVISYLSSEIVQTDKTGAVNERKTSLQARKALLLGDTMLFWEMENNIKNVGM